METFIVIILILNAIGTLLGMEHINVGDRVLVNKLFGSMFHATILAKTWGLFGRKYLAKWNYTYRDYDDSGERIGYLYWWRVVCKN